MNEFLNNQQVNGQILNNTGSKATHMSSKQNNRMLSANKNSSQPGLPMTDQKQSQRNANMNEFQTQPSALNTQ